MEFHIFSCMCFTAAFCYARLLSWCSFLNVKSTEEVPGSAADSLSQGITHAEVMCASPPPEALKHTGASRMKPIINCVMHKWNKSEVQTQECALWCLGKGGSMEEGRETRKWFSRCSTLIDTISAAWLKQGKQEQMRYDIFGMRYDIFGED